ncbi:MAG: glycosyltransferase, partial [Lachnospiraceae bacterium]|nr:glycosyltransferase [Lachnospiraceae bacterium]
MEEHRATISLILPVYHVAAYLPRCMESIAAQTRTPDEVILVDDGSGDECGPMCDRYAASGIGSAPVRVIHQENAGASAARNTGLKAAKGEWVAFVDPDDWLEPDYCEAALSFAIRSDADLVCFDGWREKGEKRSGWFQYGRDFVTSDKDRLIAMQCRVIFFVPKPGQPDQSLAAPWDKLYRRAFLEKNHLRFP